MLKMLSRVSVELVVFVAILTSIVSAASAEESWFGAEFSVLQKVYDDCLDKDDFTGCLKGRALVALNKAISQVCNQIKILPSIYLYKSLYVYTSRFVVFLFLLAFLFYYIDTVHSILHNFAFLLCLFRFSSLLFRFLFCFSFAIDFSFWFCSAVTC